MTAIKYLLIAISAWIASFWPSAWTSLLILVFASGACLALAAEYHRRQNVPARPHRRRVLTQ